MPVGNKYFSGGPVRSVLCWLPCS